MALSLGKKDCCTNTYAMSSISLNLPDKTFPSLLLGQELLTHHCAEFPSQRPLPSISFIFPGSWGLLLSASIPWFLLSHSLPTLAQWLWPRSDLTLPLCPKIYFWMVSLPRRRGCPRLPGIITVSNRLLQDQCQLTLFSPMNILREPF